MRKLIYDRVVILSAELSGLTQRENLRRTVNLKGCLDDLGFSYNRAIGKYRDSIETSFVVRVNDLVSLEALEDLAFNNFKQESILVQNTKGKAYLVMSDGYKEQLGELRMVSKETARKQDGYTLMNGNYYAIA